VEIRTRSFDEVLPSIAYIAEGIEGEVLFQLSVDAHDRVCDVECLASRRQPKNTIPLLLLLERVVQVGARAAIYVSKGSGPAEELAECDVDFTRRLIEAGRVCDIEVRDHYIVERGGYVSLRATTDLWEDLPVG